MLRRPDRAPAPRPRSSQTSVVYRVAADDSGAGDFQLLKISGDRYHIGRPTLIEEAVMTEQELRTQVLDACHGLAASGMGDTVGGHVSVRVPGKDLYWTKDRKSTRLNSSH